MVPVSIIIITKNAASIITNCIEMALLITDDVLIINNGHNNETVGIVKQSGCRLYQKNWNGYGANKNEGMALARHDWILSIDADEVPNMELVLALYELDLDDPNVVYDIKFRSFFGRKLIKHGSWGQDHHIRLFNRKLVKWSETEVHERLLLANNIKVKRLTGNINHYSVQNTNDCNSKAIYYAKLSAKQYLKTGRKATFLKLHCSPAFGFIKNYLFRLGFLDGAEGLDIALMTYKNTRLKYAYLKLYEKSKPATGTPPVITKNFVVEY